MDSSFFPRLARNIPNHGIRLPLYERFVVVAFKSQVVREHVNEPENAITPRFIFVPD